MAKYTRHDPRNRKKNKHKNMAKEGRRQRMHRVDEEKWTKTNLNELKKNLNQLSLEIDSGVI